MYKELKREAYEANMEIPKLELAIYTFGNVSAFDSAAGVLAIKPSGVDYEKLDASMMVLVDLDGKIIEGDLRPSSDTKTHIVLYSKFAGINGVCHTHSTYATAWAQAAIPVPILGTTHADFLSMEIPVTDFMPDGKIKNNYEEETGYQIINAFAELNPSEIQMTLVAGHGPFCWGGSAAKAVYHAKVLEEISKMAYLTMQINPRTSSLKRTLIDKHYQRKHGKDAYYGQDKKGE